MKISGGYLINLGVLEIRDSTYRFDETEEFALFKIDAAGNIQWSAGLSFFPPNWKHTSSKFDGLNGDGQPIISIRYVSASGNSEVIDAVKEK